MSVIIIGLFIATLLPLLGKGPVAYAMNKLGGYDNKHPRNQQAQLTGFGARALAAHQNSFESLIMFAPAVLLALVTNHTGETVQYMVITHVIARILYSILYLMNLDVLRSLAWGVGTICTFAIIWVCI